MNFSVANQVMPFLAKAIGQLNYPNNSNKILHTVEENNWNGKSLLSKQQVLLKWHSLLGLTIANKLNLQKFIQFEYQQ